jgi:hypothetical protein
VRARFEERFTAKRMAREYLQHYEVLLKANSKPIKDLASGAALPA